MLEALLSDYFLSFFSSLFTDFDEQHLNLLLTQGQAKLSDLHFCSDMLQSLFLPLTIRYGHIDSFELHLPSPLSLLSENNDQPISCIIDSIALVVQPLYPLPTTVLSRFLLFLFVITVLTFCSSEYVSCVLQLHQFQQDHYFAQRRERLAQEESVAFGPSSIETETRSSSLFAPLLSSLSSRLLQTFLNKLSVTIRRFHLRFEHAPFVSEVCCCFCAVLGCFSHEFSVFAFSACCHCSVFFGSQHQRTLLTSCWAT